MKVDAKRAPGAGVSALATSRARTGFWPSASEKALLRAALLEPPAAQDALLEWQRASGKDALDYPTLTLLPLLYRNLERHGLAVGTRDRLRGIYRWSWHRNQLLLHALEHALATLREARVEAMVMKGIPLALFAYADLGARVMGDADVVVRQRDACTALGTLQAAGWRPERPLTRDVMAGLSGVNVTSPEGCVIDLNWHVLPDSYDARDDEPFWQAAETIQVRDESVGCLAPADHLLQVVSHGLSWAANVPLHWAADATVLMRTSGDGIDWERLVAQAERHGRVEELGAGLEYVARNLSARFPDSVLERLRENRSTLGQRTAFWFAERSGPDWVWGRLPLVVASYLRVSRAAGSRPGPGGLLRYAATRAGCSPAEWLGRARVDGRRHLGRFVALSRRRLLDSGPGGRL